MKASKLIAIAARSILKNRMRALLTTLGIVIGVAAVIVMVAIGQGAKVQIQQRIDSLGTNMIVVTPGAVTAGGVNQGAGTASALTLADAEALQRESPLLSAVSPVIVAPSQVVGGLGNWRTRVNGVSTDYAVIRDWDVESGRWFDATDVKAMRKVAVIGSTISTILFPDRDPIGQQLRIRDVPFEIIGVLVPKGQNAGGVDQDDVVLAPYTTVGTRLSGRTFIPQILASTERKEDIPAAQADMRAILRETHKLPSYESDDFTVRDQTDLAQAAQGATQVMRMLLAAIASISLLVGGIGIMNIMLVSVTERTREIGIRMAVGARGSDVLRQFLVESIVLCMIGGLIGVGAGYAGAAILQHITGWGTAVVPAMVGIAIVFSAAVGIFFGFYPARKAAALDPIEALRYE